MSDSLQPHVSAMYTQTNVGLLCCVGSGSNVALHGRYTLYTITLFFLLDCPDVLRLVGDSLSGNGCGSPNHKQF